MSVRIAHSVTVHAGLTVRDELIVRFEQIVGSDGARAAMAA